MTGKRLLLLGCTFALLAAAAGAEQASAASTEGAVPAMLAPSMEAPLFAPDEIGAPDFATWSYYHVLGVSMTPRDTTATVTYDGLGCAHMTGGDGFATFPVTIPDGSLIKYVRLYYCDTNASDVSAWLTEYNPPGQAFTDLVNVPSGSAAGCGTALSTELTYTVSNTSALAVLTSGSAADRQYCGIRIAYYLPYIFRDGFGTGNPGRWSSVTN